ncbi:MAG: CapA family protein [Bacteroidales bacterium]|nr:CapA family protein [Bacteroidales bacterium]
MKKLTTLAISLFATLWAVSAQTKDTITVAVCGDIMMGTTYPKVRLPENSGRDIFKDVGAILRNADITLGNLEGTLCDTGKSTKGNGAYSYAFRTPTSYAHLLTDAGFDYLSMANNHSRDFGTEGIESTERSLEGQGIEYSGVAGRKEWAVVERGGIRYGVCAFGHNSYTVKHTDLNWVKRILDTLKGQSDIIIVSFHGGAEGFDWAHLPYGPESYIGENRGDLRTFAHFCIDNGAAMVFGHGPHVTRCIEVYKGRFIAYSLGNFATPYGISLDGIKGHAPVVTVRMDKNGAFIDGQIHPFIQYYGKGPRVDTKGVVIQNMKDLSDVDVPESMAVVQEDGKIVYKEEFRIRLTPLPEIDFDLPEVKL